MPAYVENLVRGAEIQSNLDLGAPERRVGDRSVFEAPFYKNGVQFSFEGGVCHRVRLPEVWHCVVTHKWPKGDLTVQFLQDFSGADKKPWYFAITGGTGDYEGANGQVTYVSEQDITFSFST